VSSWAGPPTLRQAAAIPLRDWIKLVWVACCAIFGGAAAHEWGRLIGLSREGGWTLVIGIFLVIAIWPLLELPAMATQIIYSLSAAYWILLVPRWLWRHSLPASRMWAIAGACLVIVAAALALAELRDGGAWFVLCILGVVWISDSAAYFVGSVLGRHKLAPRISPGKTWEGAAGAMVFVSIYALFWGVFSSGILPERLTGTPSGWLMLVGFMLLLAVLGVYGDLFESFLKRRAGVKDSGTLLPGHGGILDRVDALLPTMPVAALLMMQKSYGG
jgi:phosphatidate cytidylyltransferase